MATDERRVATAVAPPPTRPASRTGGGPAPGRATTGAPSVWGWRLAGYVFFLGFWEFASGRLMDETLLPGPLQVVQTFGELWASGKVPARSPTP